MRLFSELLSFLLTCFKCVNLPRYEIRTKILERPVTVTANTQLSGFSQYSMIVCERYKCNRHQEGGVLKSLFFHWIQRFLKQVLFKEARTVTKLRTLSQIRHRSVWLHYKKSVTILGFK